jgi:hypothetical protein
MAVIFVLLGGLALILFRDQIGDLISRTDQVEFETPIGTLSMTDSPVETTADNPQVSGNAYTDPVAGFTISWPDGWIGDTQSLRLELAQAFGIDPALLPIVIHDGFTDNPSGSNVNVVLESVVGNTTASQYLRDATPQLQDLLNVRIQASDSDDATGTGFLSGEYSLEGRDLLLFQRFQVHEGTVYVVTATGFPSVDDLSIRTQEELLSIFNSFRLVDPVTQ